MIPVRDSHEIARFVYLKEGSLLHIIGFSASLQLVSGLAASLTSMLPGGTGKDCPWSLRLALVVMKGEKAVWRQRKERQFEEFLGEGGEAAEDSMGIPWSIEQFRVVTLGQRAANDKQAMIGWGQR